MSKKKQPVDFNLKKKAHEGKLFTLAWGKQETRILKDGRRVITDSYISTHHVEGKFVEFDTSKYIATSIGGQMFQPMLKTKLAKKLKPKTKDVAREFIQRGGQAV